MYIFLLFQQHNNIIAHIFPNPMEKQVYVDTIYLVLNLNINECKFPNRKNSIATFPSKSFSVPFFFQQYVVVEMWPQKNKTKLKEYMPISSIIQITFPIIDVLHSVYVGLGAESCIYLQANFIKRLMELIQDKNLCLLD